MGDEHTAEDSTVGPTDDPHIEELGGDNSYLSNEFATDDTETVWVEGRVIAGVTLKVPKDSTDAERRAAIQIVTSGRSTPDKIEIGREMDELPEGYVPGILNENKNDGEGGSNDESSDSGEASGIDGSEVITQ